LGDAIHEGFARAWPSIRDSNISSILTAIILYWLGTSAVIKGFALVFLIGVLVSMFSAVTASRLFMYSLGFNMERRGGIINFLFGSGFTK
jgi:preprotein translocase subunit SecD